MNESDPAIDRLLRLRPHGGLVDKKKCVELAKHFFKVEAFWANQLGMLDHLPCMDIAEVIAPETEVPHLEEFNASGFAQSTAEGRACRSYLRWSQLKLTKPELIAEFGLEDPYEVLLLFFESGGELSIEHGWLADVAGCGGFEIRGLRRRAVADLSG